MVKRSLHLRLKSKSYDRRLCRGFRTASNSPGVIKKQKAVSHGLPTFDLEKVTILRDLGFGGFGSVHLGHHVCSTGVQSVVVKKLRGESEALSVDC